MPRLEIPHDRLYAYHWPMDVPVPSTAPSVGSRVPSPSHTPTPSLRASSSTHGDDDQQDSATTPGSDLPSPGTTPFLPPRNPRRRHHKPYNRTPSPAPIPLAATVSTGGGVSSSAIGASAIDARRRYGLDNDSRPVLPETTTEEGRRARREACERRIASAQGILSTANHLDHGVISVQYQRCPPLRTSRTRHERYNTLSYARDWEVVRTLPSTNLPSADGHLNPIKTLFTTKPFHRGTVRGPPVTAPCKRCPAPTLANPRCGAPWGSRAGENAAWSSGWVARRTSSRHSNSSNNNNQDNNGDTTPARASRSRTLDPGAASAAAALRQAELSADVVLRMRTRVIPEMGTTALDVTFGPNALGLQSPRRALGAAEGLFLASSAAPIVDSQPDDPVYASCIAQRPVKRRLLRLRPPPGEELAHLRPQNGIYQVQEVIDDMPYPGGLRVRLRRMRHWAAEKCFLWCMSSVVGHRAEQRCGCCIELVAGRVQGSVPLHCDRDHDCSNESQAERGQESEVAAVEVEARESDQMHGDDGTLTAEPKPCTAGSARAEMWAGLHDRLCKCGGLGHRKRWELSKYRF